LSCDYLGLLQPETQVWDSRLAGFYEFGLQSK